MPKRKSRSVKERKITVSNARRRVSELVPEVQKDAYDRGGTKADRLRADKLTGVARSQGVRVPVRGRAHERSVASYEMEHATRGRGKKKK